MTTVQAPDAPKETAESIRRAQKRCVWTVWSTAALESWPETEAAGSIVWGQREQTMAVSFGP
jgi:hypothetical protein